MKQYYLSYRPWTECSISQFFKTNCTQSIFRTINPELLSRNRSKNSQKHLYGQPVLTFDERNFAVNINRVTLQHNKEFIMFIFLFNGFITMCNLKKRLTRAAFWVLLQASMNDWQQTEQRLKLQERLLTINKRNIIRWNIYRDNNFHSRRQVLKCL